MFLAHPPARWLGWVKAGTAPEEVVLELEGHLKSCDDCRKAMETCEPLPDGGLLADLRDRTDRLHASYVAREARRATRPPSR